jgi:iron complex transport system permease protein
MASTALSPRRAPEAPDRAPPPLPALAPPAGGAAVALDPIVWPRLGIRRVALVGMLAATVFMFLVSLAFGSVSIPLDQIVTILMGGEAARDTWPTIVWMFRLPKALTAVLAGAALAIAGLQMQTLFRNPLADPFVLGISAGASLGVALVVLGTAALGVVGGGVSRTFLAGIGLLGELGVVGAACIGAGSVFGLIMLVSRRLQSTVTLLVLGLMFGYATSAIVSVLIYFSAPDRIQAFAAWGFGSFGAVTWQQLRVLVPVVLLGLAIAYAASKSLNALLLGEGYARTMGLNVRRARFWLLTGSALLAGAVTAFCGPIGFLGVAVPHLARSLFRTADHRILVPAVILIGATLALGFDVVSQMPGTNRTLPLNAVTALLGAPLIGWVILRRQHLRTAFGA